MSENLNEDFCAHLGTLTAVEILTDFFIFNALIRVLFFLPSFLVISADAVWHNKQITLREDVNDSLCHLKKIALLTETLGRGFGLVGSFFPCLLVFHVWMCNSIEPRGKWELGVLIKSAECHKVMASLASRIKLQCLLCGAVWTPRADFAFWNRSRWVQRQLSKRRRTHLSYTGILVSCKEEERFSSLLSCLVP